MAPIVQKPASLQPWEKTGEEKRKRAVNVKTILKQFFIARGYLTKIQNTPQSPKGDFPPALMATRPEESYVRK
jgi:hypothetical protein